MMYLKILLTWSLLGIVIQIETWLRFQKVIIVPWLIGVGFILLYGLFEAITEDKQGVRQ